MKKESEFKVFTVTPLDNREENKYTHWSDRLKMFITKNDVTIELNEDEIRELVKSLPRTVGGTY
jgi:hypothetical protein